MNFYADYVRNKLNAAISSMSSQIEDYVKNPGHDFTRNRKMNFTSTINFLSESRKSNGDEFERYL